MARRQFYLASVVTLAAIAGTSAQAKIKVGDPAPKFTLKTVDGEKISPDELRGKVVLLNFWATWCVPCKAEMPLLDLFERKFHDKGLAIYAVATEDSVSPTVLKKKLGPVLKLTLVRSLHGSSYQVMGGVPTNYVIDRKGILRYAKAGAFDLDQLNATLIPLLNESPPPELAANPTSP